MPEITRKSRSLIERIERYIPSFAWGPSPFDAARRGRRRARRPVHPHPIPRWPARGHDQATDEGEAAVTIIRSHRPGRARRFESA